MFPNPRDIPLPCSQLLGSGLPSNNRGIRIYTSTFLEFFAAQFKQSITTAHNSKPLFLDSPFWTSLIYKIVHASIASGTSKQISYIANRRYEAFFQLKRYPVWVHVPETLARNTKELSRTFSWAGTVCRRSLYSKLGKRINI